MAIISHAEHDEVEGMIMEGRSDGLFVIFGGFFGFHSVDVGNGKVFKACFHSHEVVAVGMGGGNASFIAPKEVDFRPVEIGVGGKSFVDGFWG